MHCDLLIKLKGTKIENALSPAAGTFLLHYCDGPSKVKVSCLEMPSVRQCWTQKGNGKSAALMLFVQKMALERGHYIAGPAKRSAVWMASKAEGRREEKKAARPAMPISTMSLFCQATEGLEELDLGCELLVAWTRITNIPSDSLKNLRLPREVLFIFGLFYVANVEYIGCSEDKSNSFILFWNSQVKKPGSLLK